MCARLQGYDLIGIMEMWWDGSYDWSVGMEGYRLFRKDRQDRRGRGVSPSVSMTSCSAWNSTWGWMRSLWVRIKGSTGAREVIAGICYRPPKQEDRADEALYRQEQPHVHKPWSSLRDFNHPAIGWRDNAAGHKESRKFLECVDDNFLLQVTEEPMRRGATLDLVLTNKEGLVGDVKLKGSLGCSDHEMVEFRILEAVRSAHSKLIALDFRGADFGLFRNLPGRYHGTKPWSEEGPKTAGWYSRVTSSKLRSDASQQRRSQAKMPRALPPSPPHG
ncbi:hypothetical protein GRJ2_002716600 [Grus japonensis]|uniref:Uncharacterized protein n=1 Tax=Grus japonensis TaxID=30415 RepID=A0ABC9XXM7_GRUJA